MNTIESINLIYRNPKIRGGRPCIVGTGLRVTDVVMAMLFHQRNPSEISSDYQITLAQTHAALAYYYEHRDELDADIRQQIETARELKERGVGQRKDSLLPR